jgi:predicted GNAT superfamily acetyltransferase
VIEVRALTATHELEEAVRLQKAVWGFADIELLPLRLFVVATKVGGQAFGAYDNSQMVGFLLAIPGLKPRGGTYLHSHMLGVLPEWRDRGVGRMLKLRQRDDAATRGINLIEWTFDPLESKNAFFNIERLGAIVRRYVENQYGTTTSPLHGGLPTDRCVAEWWLSSDRVKTVLAGGSIVPDAVQRCEVPADIGTLRHTEPKRAREIQKTLGQRLCDAFARGLAIIGVERSADVYTYLLGKWECGSNA